jgi:predicted DNA-binding antitoxin AbrB/MazE fold protein
MKETIEAIYEKGVFRPLETPDISEGLKVRLEVETLPESSVDDLLELAAKVYRNLSDEQIDEIEQIAFDRDELFGKKGS